MHAEVGDELVTESNRVDAPRGHAQILATDELQVRGIGDLVDMVAAPGDRSGHLTATGQVPA